MSIESERTVSDGDFPSLETLAKKAISEKQPFVRLEVSKENLLKMFKVSYVVVLPFDKIVAQQVQGAHH